MQYPAHAAFVAPARDRPQLWRLVAGLALILVIYIIGIGAIFGILAALSGFEGAQNWMSEIAVGAGPTGTLLLLATFIGMALGPMAAAKVLHGRKARGLFGPFPRLIRDFLIAGVICTVVFAVTTQIPLPGAAVVPNLDPSLWASFLPLALVGVLLQTGAEEVLFRGYLQQQLAARFASPLIWMILPSALFAVLHYQPEVMGDNTWLMICAAFVFGVAAADLTAVSGSIGPAWGMHFVNNALGILVVSMDGPLSGLSLYMAPIAQDAAEIRPLFVLEIATTVALWAVIRIAVSRPTREHRRGT